MMRREASLRRPKKFVTLCGGPLRTPSPNGCLGVWGPQRLMEIHHLDSPKFLDFRRFQDGLVPRWSGSQMVCGFMIMWQLPQACDHQRKGGSFGRKLAH